MTDPKHVLTIRDTREALPGLCAEAAKGGGEPVFFGARRKTEAVILPYHQWVEMTSAMRRLALADALGSVQASGLQPGPEVDPIMGQWTRGEIDNDTMRARVRALYDTPASPPG